MLIAISTVQDVAKVIILLGVVSLVAFLINLYTGNSQ